MREPMLAMNDLVNSAPRNSLTSSERVKSKTRRDPSNPKKLQIK